MARLPSYAPRTGVLSIVVGVFCFRTATVLRAPLTPTPGFERSETEHCAVRGPARVCAAVA
ncbi:hypothetical protein [Nocardia gamkensis]|uniref:Uncharacterized protein n=1 Tax=Nocardia gamkensis TaxID=352869 RepID=A0A7X6L3K1_9NOCA|nr:hypothetical protein [Nocardia gamkensis]NKY27125.1 hypothetical protein [Nocardia gamkensis]